MQTLKGKIMVKYPTYFWRKLKWQNIVFWAQKDAQWNFQMHVAQDV